jgi:quercetin dioxygenase-like cupin family protein
MSNPAKPTSFSFGKLRGTIYDFDDVDDVLARHSHTEETAHITIVAKGKIKVTAGEWTYDAEAGRVIDLPANQEHEFIALKKNSRIVNIVKGGGEYKNG